MDTIIDTVSMIKLKKEIIMETTVKINVEKLREDIKKLVEEQKYLKDQRKTVHIKGQRKMEPWQATMRHAQNREDLSIMYAALLVLRGWSIDEAAKAHLPKCFDWYYDRLKPQIQELIDEYKEDKE